MGRWLWPEWHPDASRQLFVNRCAWAHILLEAARLLGRAPTELLTVEGLAVLEGRAAPHGVITASRRPQDGLRTKERQREDCNAKQR